MRTLAEFATSAVGVPFARHGRDHAGWDCWGLLRAYVLEVHGDELPSYAEVYEDTGHDGPSRALNERLLLARLDERWQPLDRVEPGAGLLFRVAGRAVHVGVALNRRRFLHCEEKTGTQVDRLDGVAWGRRLEGAYAYVPR